MTYISEVLVDVNPWWKAEFRLEYKEREIYKKFEEFIPQPQIIAFTGLRRVGKTTLMLKVAKDMVAQGLDAKRVVYFSFDEFRDAKLREIILEYEQLMGVDLKSGKTLLLFDEVQKLQGWEDQLKSLYDTHKDNLKIIISGSESLFIMRKSKETLAGRLFEFKIEPLNFREYLGFRMAKPEPPGLYGGELKRLFDEFALTLGFPELVNVSAKEVIRKYLREGIIDKAVHRDIRETFNVRDTSTLESLLNILMAEPGQIIEISEIANDLKTSRQTASNYLTYLQDSFLVRKLYNWSRNRRKVERKLRKYYPAIVSPSLLFKEDDHSKSKVFEWLVIKELGAEYFWRDARKNEVDAVIGEDKPTPVEIKYGKIETTGVLAFMKKFGADEGYIITPDREETRVINGKTIRIVPAYKYLLGRA